MAVFVGASAYNGGAPEGLGNVTQKRISTRVRCVPRFGYDYANVREVEVDVDNPHDDAELHEALVRYFAYLSIADAVFDVDVDDDGYFAVINDEAYARDWGDVLF